MPNRTMFTIPLEPALGSRFQPTGFPDLGAALFDRPTRDEEGKLRWEKSLLVESPQSMANHLEATCWDPATTAPVASLAPLPWVRVVNGEGDFISSSRLESHRLAASYVKDAKLGPAKMKDVIRERLGLRDNVPLAPRAIAAAVFRLDPLCLLHGVFFAESAKVWPGQPKIARAVTAVIEAHDVRAAESGGVKRDAVGHSKGENQDAGGGYGSVPFHRTEWTAAAIVLQVSIDQAQLSSYGLSDDATQLLSTLALWQLRVLVDNGLRPRTACDLRVVGEVEGLPPLHELTDRLGDLIGRCAGDLGDGGSPLTVVWAGADPSKRKPAPAEAADASASGAG
jgi:CRISPR-associated protein Csb1